MAPITDEKVQDLKDMIEALEKRVHDLEGKLSSKGSSTTSASESMRMILIGPPGAGETWSRDHQFHMLKSVQERVHKHQR